MSKYYSPIPRGRPQGELTAEELTAEELTAEETAEEVSATDAGRDALSADDRQLLAAARSALRRDPVPGPVRQRLFERMLDEARRPEPHLVLPTPLLVPVHARGAWVVLGSAAAMALGLVLLANARSLFRGSGNDEPLAESSPPRAEQHLGDRIFQSELFRAPAPAWSGALPPADASLFGERPFSMQSDTWQVKRWDDLSQPPAEAAKYDFERGALCVTLRGGDRVIGGWPWLPSVDRALGATPAAVPVRSMPAPIGSVSAPLAAPPRVALTAGKAYRLVFKAWASEPLPAQLLIAVGHSELPFSTAGGARVEVSTEPEPYVVSFLAKHDDPSVGVAFLANASENSGPTRLCLSDMTLTERAP